MTLILLWLYVPQPDVELADHLTLRSALNGYATLLQRRDVIAAIVVFVVNFGGYSLYMTYLPTWIELTVGVGGSAIATMFFIGSLGNTLAGPPAGKLSDHIGRKIIIISTSLVIAVVILATTYLINNMWIAYGLFIVVMGLFAARIAAFQTHLTDMVDSSKRGSFLDLTVGIGQIGSGLSGGPAGAIYVGLGMTARL